MRTHYNNGDEILEIIVRDQTGGKIETLRCNMSDNKQVTRIIRYLKSKYGITFMESSNQESDFWRY